MPLSIAIDERLDYLDENLSALASYDTELTDALRHADDPPTAQPATARDGSPSYRIPEADGGWRWLGGASTPRIRAEATVERFAPDGANLLVPTLGSGLEVKALLERTPRHCAVFCLIDVLADARLALRLNNFAGYIRDHRLALFPLDAWESHARRLFERFPGLEFPTKMFVPPEFDARRLENIRIAGERVIQSMVSFRTVFVESASRSLADRSRRLRGIKRLTILSLDPRPSVAEAACGLQHASSAHGVSVTTYLPDRPDRCHWLARLKAVVDDDADAVLLLNSGWGQLGQYVPANFPSACWLLPDAGTLAGKTDGFRRGQYLFSASKFLKPQVVEMAVPERHVHHLDPGMDDTIFCPLTGRPDSATTDVVILGDLQELSPASCGITLPTQIALWEAIRQIVRADSIRSAQDIVTDGERTSGVQLKDVGVRKLFIDLVRQRLISTQQLQKAANAIFNAGIGIGAHGRGWQACGLPGECLRRPLSSPRQRNKVYQGSRVVVCPWPDAVGARIAAEATLAGASVVVATRGESLESGHPWPADVVGVLPSYSTESQLVSIVRALLDGDTDLTAHGRRARQIILERHLWSHRLGTILDTLARTGADK